MNTSIGQRLATVVLVAGVVGGFGSGIASCGRHMHEAHERGGWARGEHCDRNTSAKAAPTTTPAPTETAPTTPAPTAPTTEAAPAEPTTPPTTMTPEG
jgi:hypothetical protein